MAGRAAPARLGSCTFYVVPSQRCGVLPRRASLGSHQPGSPWCRVRGPGPGSAQSSSVHGAAGLPMVSGELHGSTRTRARPAAGRKAYGQRGLPRGRLSHAAAGTATAPRRGVTCPAAMRASRIVDMVSAGWVRASTGCREKGPRPGVTPVTLTLVSAEPGRAGPGPAHGAVEPDRDERGDVRPSVGPDRGNPEQLGLVQRPAVSSHPVATAFGSLNRSSRAVTGMLIGAPFLSRANPPRCRRATPPGIVAGRRTNPAKAAAAARAA